MSVLEPGQRLGSYSVEDLVGRGGMAEVYRAKHMALERAVAIKVLNPVLNADPTFLLRFLREAKAIARLDHPNIITVHDYGEHGQLAYLVMAFAAGGTLRERARTFCTLEEALAGLAPVIDALDYAHQRGVVHRDVKPINMLIDAQGKPLLADFGLARVAVESLETVDPTGVMGTPYYMSPEQAMGAFIDQRTDIYALGIVTYEVISGKLPYTGASPYAVIQHHISSPPPSLRLLLPDAPLALDAAIRRATAKQPADRFRTAGEFLLELQKAIDEFPDMPIGEARTANGATSPTHDAVDHAQTMPTTAASATSGGASNTAGFFTRPTRGRTPATPRATVDPSAETQALDPDILAETIGRVTPRQPDAAAAPAVVPDSNGFRPLPVARSRWSPPLSVAHWLTLVVALLALLGVGVAVAWLTAAGRDALGGLSGTLARPLFDHRTAVRLTLAGVDLALGAVNATIMRVAVLADYQLSMPTFRRLRQTHRFNGYLTALVAITVQGLTWIALLAGGLRLPWSAITLAFGSALLLLAVGKVGIVRYVPAQRRHLPLIGVTVLTLLALVFLTSFPATR